MQLKTLQTKLETASIEEVGAILDRKALDTGANATADYIALSIDNIENGVSRIDDAIKELQAIKKDLKSQEDVIKIGASKWLADNGIDKLQGDRVSSVSVFDKKESVSLIIEDEEAIINQGFFKMEVDKTAVKNALLADQEVKGAKLEIIHNEDSLKVNKRRK